MIFQKIKIENLASIEDALIDFTIAPLADASIFLICGETGSGKTTILDAICLALYDNAPRFATAQREKLFALHKEEGEKSEDIQLNDASLLMRRNTFQSLVQLFFVGNDGKEYLVQWIAKRKKKSQGNDVPNTNRTLECLTTGTIWSNKKEISFKIEEFTGMSFTHFCRTTLLAQGEFTRFLKASETDKASILEKLTGMEVYSLISMKIYDAEKEQRELCEKMKSEMQLLSCLSTEEYEMKKKEIEVLREKCNQSSLFLHWKKEEQRVLIAQKEISSRLKEIEKLLQSTEFVQLSKHLKDWKETILIRQILKNIHSDEQILLEKKKNTFSLKIEYDLFRRRTYSISTEIIQKKERHLILLSKIKEGSIHEKMYENEGLLIGKLNETLSCTYKIEKGEKEKMKLQELFQKDQEALKNQTSLYNSQHEEWIKQKEVIEQKEEECKKIPIYELQKESSTLERQKNMLSNLLNIYTKYTEDSHKLNRLLSTHKEDSELLQSMLLKEEELKKEGKQKKKDLEEEKKRLEQLNLSKDNFLSSVRLKLSKGDICPLCGNIVQEVITDEALMKIIKPIEDSVNEKAEKIDELYTLWNKNHAEICSKQDIIERTQKEIEELQKTCKSSYSSIEEKSKEMGIESTEENLPKSIQSKLLNIEKRIQKVQSQIDLAQKKDRELSLLSNQEKVLRKKLEEVKESLDTSNQRIKQLESGIEKLQNETALYLQKREEYMEESVALITWDKEDFKKHWEENPSSLIEKLKKEAQEYRLLLKQQAQEEKLILDMEREEEQCLLAQREVEKNFPSWKEEKMNMEVVPFVQSFSKDFLELSYRSNQLRGEENAISKKLQEEQEQYQNYLREHPEFTEAYIEELAGYTTIEKDEKYYNEQYKQYEVLKSQSNEIENNLNTLNANKPTMENEDALSIEELESSIQTSSERIGELKHILEEDDKRHTMMEEKEIEYQKRYAEWCIWGELKKYFGDAEGRPFKKIAQSYVLNFLLKQANLYLEQLSGRYLLQRQAGSLAILLNDTYQHAVSGSANLSGGESFLVSLSLALSLSSLHQGGCMSNILFIDEGFGTLSGDVLEKVIEVLMRLEEMGGRKVGIISHVEELKEKIHTQIRVKKMDMTRSSISVIEQ